VTSHPTRARRRSAASCERIDLVPSRRVAILWLGWLIIVCASILAVDLGWPLRLSLCLALASFNLRAIQQAVLLRGPLAIRCIEWEPDGRLRIGPATAGELQEAQLRPGAFRLGIAFFVLWFSTPRGLRGVLIDGGLQEPAAFRRLSRSLKLIPSRPKV
jgi:hypothetical protein